MNLDFSYLSMTLLALSGLLLSILPIRSSDLKKRKKEEELRLSGSVLEKSKIRDNNGL